MTKAKKRILMAASYVAVAAVAVGGTFALLTDQTDTAVNTRTVGNVSIAQHEYQRAEGVSHINEGAKEGDLVPFEQGQMIIPAVPKNGLNTDYSAEQANDRQFWWGEYTKGNGSNGLWDDSKLSNVMDKFVFVENTGSTDAYYRTVIAFECPEGTTYGEASAGAEFMINANHNVRFDWDACGYTTIDGSRYFLMTATYNEVLKPGEISRPSLLQVVMTHNATSEDAELLGETYDILVVSQAVQAGGFAAETDENDGIIKSAAQVALEDAFYVVDENNHPWADDNSVKDVAFYATTGEHSLNRDITLADDGAATDCVTADGEDAVVNITGGTYDAANKDCAVWAKNGATVNIYDGTFTCVGVDAPSSASHSDLIYAGSNGGKINIYGGYYSTTTAGDWLLNEKDGQGTIVVYGGTFVNWNPADNISEGSRKSSFLADGYTVTTSTDADGNTLYTVVAE